MNESLPYISPVRQNSVTGQVGDPIRILSPNEQSLDLTDKPCQPRGNHRRHVALQTSLERTAQRPEKLGPLLNVVICLCIKGSASNDEGNF